MEKQLFTWEDWDQCTDLFLSFINCVFVKDVGKYKAGDKVELIDMDFEKGCMYVYESANNINTPDVSYKLELQVNEA